MAKSPASPAPPAGPASEIIDTDLGTALGERYLSYALSTIMARSLPDVRDGLKPVHRRLLFAMRQLKLDPAEGFKKCARIVGEVMGKYHPHGEGAIYDAMVRLAQDFAVRYPLVDGQGNFGNIDGDNAAAMRYTEARLTAIAQALLEGIDEDAVDFRLNYDEEEEEPVVLPASFPNLLANGASGIAVGMATSIPPHNVGQICDALLHLLKAPNARTVKLVELIGGPDFPTGGIVAEPHENIVNAYDTGRGSFRLRAKWEVEKEKGGAWSIVVTEMPYQVQKSKLIEKIAEIINARKLPMLADVRDESAADVRLVLEPKSRTVEAEALMEHLFRLTDLEVRISLNMNVLDRDKTPRVMNLREVLQAFLDHREEVLVRRTKHRLEKIAHRIEVLEGYRIAYLNLDEVIRIIREEDDPKAEMMKKWDLTEVQADAILNMRLRSLRKLEEIAILQELKDLKTEQKDLKALLKDAGRRLKVVGGQIKDIREKFGEKTEPGRRRTVFTDAPVAEIIPLERMIEKEPVTVICSEKGWIRTMRGHLEDGKEKDIKYKEGDGAKFLIRCQTTDRLVLFASNGRFYTLGADKLPGGRGHGEPVRLMVDIPNEHDIVALMAHEPGRRLLVASRAGRGFIVSEDDVLAQTRQGKQVLNVDDTFEAVVCTPAAGDTVAVLGRNRKLLLFGRDELPEMGRGRGVVLQKYKADSWLMDAVVFDLAEGLPWAQGDRTRTLTKDEVEDWVGKRAQVGKLPPKGAPRGKTFS